MPYESTDLLIGPDVKEFNLFVFISSDDKTEELIEDELVWLASSWFFLDSSIIFHERDLLLGLSFLSIKYNKLAISREA